MPIMSNQQQMSIYFVQQKNMNLFSLFLLVTRIYSNMKLKLNIEEQKFIISNIFEDKHISMI